MITFGAHEAWRQESGPDLAMVRVGTDTAPLDDWRELCGVEPTGAVLVRPDQHVAWRAAALPSQPGAAVAAAFGQIVGRTS